ncbi:prephenate dehydratase [Boothiomyces sp. JEL0866]|nr:prephenate dehydratase [Boothiomyces sp. JEL0866]
MNSDCDLFNNVIAPALGLKINSNGNCCYQYGINCDGNSFITSLQLDWRQMTGYIPPEIGQLSQLQVLVLANNKLQGNPISNLGTIPKEIGQLYNLYKLDLSNNQLSGPVPQEIYNLPSYSASSFDFGNLLPSVPLATVTTILTTTTSTTTTIVTSILPKSIPATQTMTFGSIVNSTSTPNLSINDTLSDTTIFTVFGSIVGVLFVILFISLIYILVTRKDEVPDDDDEAYLLKRTLFKNLNHNVPDKVDLLPKVVQLNSFSTDVNQDDIIEIADSSVNDRSVRASQSVYRVSVDHSTQTDFEPRYSFESESEPRYYHMEPRNFSQTEHSKMEVQPFITEIESLIGSISGKSHTDVMATIYRHATANNPNESRKEFSIDQLDTQCSNPYTFLNSLSDKNGDEFFMQPTKKMKHSDSVAFLGPKGTFSYECATQVFSDAEFVPCQSIAKVLETVQSNKADYGIVPFENSTFGTVLQTLDFFVNTKHSKGSDQPGGFVILNQHYLTVHHNLLGPETDLNRIEKVYSHPEALGQCSKWLDKHLPSANRVPVGSTAQAAERAKLESNAAGISSIACADLFNLKVIEKNIENLANNTTRFFVIGKKVGIPTSNDGTLVMFTLNHDQPGSLCDALAIMKDHGINLTKIDSRPSGKGLWHYMFFMQFDGHMNDEKVQRAMAIFKTKVLDFMVLGSYHK